MYACVCMYVCIYIYIYVCMYVCMYVCVYINIYRSCVTWFPHTYTHAYIHSYRWFGGIVFAIFTFCVARCIVCRNRNGPVFFLLPGNRYMANGAVGEGDGGLSIEVRAHVCMY